MKNLILFIVVACCILSCNKDHEVGFVLKFNFEPERIEAVASDTIRYQVELNGLTKKSEKPFQFSLREVRFWYVDEFVGSDSTRVEIPYKDSEWDKYTQTWFGALYLPIKGDWYEITYENEVCRYFDIKLKENKTNKVRKLRICISNYTGYETTYEVVQQP